MIDNRSKGCRAVTWQSGRRQITTITDGVDMKGNAAGSLSLLQRCVALVLLVLSPLLYADRLDQAAQPGSRAERALLLDITDTGERLVTVGEQGIILLSDDSGKHWRVARVPVSVLLTAVHFVDSRHGWAVGHDGVVLATTDGGEHWQRLLTGNAINTLRKTQLTQALADLPASADDERRESLEYALDDADVATEDGPTSPLLDVWFRDRHTGFVLGAYGLLLKTTDGGNSWQSLGHRTENPENFHLNSLQPLPDGRLIIAGEAGLLLQSRDGGDNWQALDSPYEGSFFAMGYSDQLYLAGLRGHLFSTGDAEHWQPLEASTRSTLTAVVTAGTQLWLLGQGGVVLERTPSGLSSLTGSARRNLSAGVWKDNHLILVGEGGVSLLPLNGKGAES